MFSRNFFWILLLPLSFLWAAVTRLRRRFYPRGRRYQASVPAVCIGNIHSGGSGKTPIVMAIAARYPECAIVSRGYRGRLSREGARVDAANLRGSEDYGDEPWMLAQRTGRPVFIGRDRAKAVRAAEAAVKPRLVVLDDGFQHLALGRKADIVVIRASVPLSESFCLPWGDLREPLSAIGSAAAVVLNPGDGIHSWRSFLSSRFPSVRVFETTQVADGLWDGDDKVEPDGKFAAFCGIARPDGFEAALSPLGAPAFVAAFPDHHAYTPAEAGALIERAKAAGAGHFVTTEKDWFKARPLLAEQGWRVSSLRIHYEFPDEFWYFLDSLIEREPFE